MRQHAHKNCDEGVDELRVSFCPNQQTLSTLTLGVVHLGAWALDGHSRKMIWSPQMYALHELAPGVPIDLNRALGFVSPQQRTTFRDMLMCALQSGQPVRTEIAYTTAWGHRRNGRWIAEAQLQDDDIVGLVGTFEDITPATSIERELRETNAQLHRQLEQERQSIQAMRIIVQETQARADESREAANAKTAFLANMSHEIRTPMTSILGFTEILREELASAPQSSAQTEALEIIRRNGEHLLTLINDILDLSKIESGMLSTEVVAFSPIQLVSEVESLIRIRLHRKPVELRLEFEGQIPETIETDPTRLRQIMINIVGNAAKFTNAGSIRIITRLLRDPRGLDSHHILFDVVDTGIGMTSEQLNRLFQPFVQADASTTREFGGTGLGLAVSKRLALLLGGDIAVESMIGQGSRFRITIPTGSLTNVRLIDNPDRTVASGQSSIIAGQNDAPKRLLGLRILLAEDGPDNQRLITAVLRREGATVALADNGRDAVEDALGQAEAGAPYDVILMDMQMPILDGYAATSMLRAEGYTHAIVALTAHAMTHDRDACIKAGCDDYAAKPIHRERLMDTICNAAGAPQQRGSASE